MKLRNFFPQSLMGRSLLILVVPVVLAQIIAVTVFWDNHWDKMTRRLASSVAGEIAIAADQMENNFSRDRYESLQDYLSQYLGLTILFEENAILPATHQDFDYVDMLVIRPLLRTLNEQLPQPHLVFLDRNIQRVSIFIQLQNGVLKVFVPQRRLFSSSGYVFVLLLLGSSFSLLLISVVFLRNQIRPIRKLAVAALRMSKGRPVSLGKPSGAREVRQAAEAFEIMQRRIRRQIEQRTTMLAGVSHDLRTPLTRIRLGLSMLEDSDDTQALLADLDEMEKMITAYLEFARGEKPEEASSVNLAEFLTEVMAPYKTETLETTLIAPSAPAPQIFLQKVNFRRCLENILGNAARYATKIQISLEITPQRVRLRIEDNGPGIPEDQYEEVFKPFVRLDTSRNKETGGAGLGLSVAMDVVLSHGGKISLEKSQALGGLCVVIGLPV
ncbi:MAG: HAMP domain-containing protein [Rhodospirillales bacterium]|nr:HAMP domain-containing protein [Rhodospirillales bacterium]